MIDFEDATIGDPEVDHLTPRAALGLRPVTAPVMVFIPAGILLGPAGAGVLSLNVLSHLDPVISIVLATLGVFIGIAAGTQRGAVSRLMAVGLPATNSAQPIPIRPSPAPSLPLAV